VTGTVTTRKAERLMNLVICLLVTRGYVSKDRIRKVVDGYRDQSVDAFEKMFERDKEELREIGIPIEVGSHESLFDDEPGYRIRRGAFELPEITLEPDEAAVVGLAARVWQHAGLARQTTDALVKLRAGGVAVDRDALSMVEPRLAASEPAFEPLCDAVLARAPVRFGYRRPGREPTERTLEPWGVLSWRGRWYVIGRDRDRDAPRMFRLSRVTTAVRRAGRPGSYRVPEGTDLRALARSLQPPPAEGTARVRVLAGAGNALRRRALAVHAESEGWDRVDVPLAHVDELAEEVVGYGSDVVAVDPPALREAVVARLRRLAGADAAQHEEAAS
jgi:proteasome accessory factor B